MATYNGLPIYRVALAENDGVLRVSLVDDPAVESDFEVFRKADGEKAPALYSVQDEEKHLVRGVILRADYPIYRRDNAGDAGYYVTFGAEVIREAAERYIASGRANAVDLEHDFKEVDGVQLVQLFIKDTAAGVAPEGFADIADGSLFGEYHVTNEDVWAEIKAGTFKGFSVEIFYRLVPVQEAMSAARSEETTHKPKNMKKTGLLNAILDGVKRIVEKFGSITTDKGAIYWDGDEDLKAGDRVEVEDAEGNRSAAPDGDYTTPDGKVIVVVDGAVAELRDPAAEVAPENEPEAEAKEAEAEQEEAAAEQEGPADLPDGEYKTANGTIIVIAEGAIAAVTEPDAEAKEAEAKAAEEAREAEMTAIRSEAESFKAENETLKARIAELEKTPAGKPAQEQFKAEGNDAPEVEGLAIRDRGLARLARRK